MQTPKQENWHSLHAATALERIASDGNGLSEAEAARRLEQHGANSLPQPKRTPPLVRFLRQFNNLLIMVLIAAALVTSLLGHWIDTGVIMTVVMINAIIGFVQEGRAEQALEALRDMLAPRAAVLRGGTRQSIAAEGLVPGDIVVLEAGDKVPADLRVIESAGLSVEEAILTGESAPVSKIVAAVPETCELGDRTSMLYSGTLIAAGHGAGVVVATGGATEIGRISGMVAAVEPLSTPLTRQMAGFAKGLTAVVMGASAVVLAFALLVRGMDFAEGFMIVVGLFVAAIPEGLPTVLTVTLAVGVQIMARRHAVVRRLPAIETLGALSVICTDKTGTLTRNEMVVATLVLSSGQHAVTGTGYAPEGTVEGTGEGEAPIAQLETAASIAGLCNTAALIRKDDSWRVEGDPMEGALLAFAGKIGMDIGTRAKPLAAIPFDARYRYMAVLHDQEGQRLALVKGAPEAVLERCTQSLDGPLDHAWWNNQAEQVAALGQRVLALAQKPMNKTGLEHGDLEEGLTLVGLVGLIDPPREEAIMAVADCLAAGINVKMITGDHKGTAAAIAAQIGLEHADHVLTGADLDGMDDDALAAAIGKCDVFARTSPEHKLRLVTALQKTGAVVAMTGDGVNDAPALKRADAGIAMGQKSSEAARESADLVLTDDNFASIAEAVRQGRTVYANLTKVIAFLLPVNGGESMSLVIAVFAGITLPITPLQILWVNMLGSVLLAMSLAFEKPEAQVMQRPPRKADSGLLSRFTLWRIFLVSVLFSIGVFGQFVLARMLGADVDVARTMAVNTLVAMEVFYLFSIRYSLGSSLTWEGIKGTPPVLLAVGGVILLQAVLTYLPLMQTIFGTAPLSIGQLALCAASGVALLLVLEIDKRAAAMWKTRRQAVRS